MDPLSRTVTLLILTSHEEDAEGLTTSLRDGGLAVHSTFTSEPERMEELISTNPFELILCCEYDPAVDLGACMNLYRELETDIPLVVIADGATESSVLIDALRSGARDLTEHGDTDHLQLVVARELTDLHHRRAEDRLRERLEECEERSRDLIEASGEAVALIQEGIHLQVNPAFQALFGFESADDIEGFPLLDLITADHQEHVRESLRAMERGGEMGSVTLDARCTRADGASFEARLNASRSKLDGEPCLRVLAEARTPATAAAKAGALDAETSLPNRAALLQELDSRLTETSAGRNSFAIIYVGIVVFPKLLQVRGLTGGLRAAASFGTALRGLVPKNTYLARIADDGYVALISDLGQAEASTWAARIVREMRVPTDGQPDAGDTPQCGTGMMLASSITRSATDLLDTVYRDYLFGVLGALQGPTPDALPGPNDKNLDKASQERERRLAERIQHALEVGGLQLVYQPIVSLKGDSQENYSVLVRLREDERTLREAKEFLDAAGRSGQMVAIDRWVIRNAISEVAAQRAKGEKINLFIHVAEETLQEEALLIWICDCLREFQARGNWLTFLIQEEHARRHAAVFARLIDGLRKVKCRVALNGFGDGPNPDLLLRSLRLDYVKLPPDLGQGLADDQTKKRRLQELTKLTREAGVRTVVTGVEDARSLTVLWTAGVDYVQGNFLQRPSPTIDKAQ